MIYPRAGLRPRNRGAVEVVALGACVFARFRVRRPRPTSSGGEWPGANFALGTHGPSKTGRLVGRESHLTTRFKVVTAGSILRFSIPRRALGSPRWFTFLVAAARKMTRGGGIHLAPAAGTFRYTLTG